MSGTNKKLLAFHEFLFVQACILLQLALADPGGQFSSLQKEVSLIPSCLTKIGVFSVKFNF